MNKVFDYLKLVVNGDNNSAEVKAFVGLTAFFYIMVAALVDLFTPYVPTEFVFFGVLGLVLGSFGLSTYLAGKGMIVGKEPNKTEQEKPKQE